jgi:hypothetical protein
MDSFVRAEPEKPQKRWRVDWLRGKAFATPETAAHMYSIAFPDDGTTNAMKVGLLMKETVNNIPSETFRNDERLGSVHDLTNGIFAPE